MATKFKNGIDVTSGSIILPYRNFTTGTTDTILTTDYTVYYTPANAVAVTLPAATTTDWAGKVFNIKSGTASAITVTSTTNIDSALTFTIGAQYQTLTVQSNGSIWLIV